MRTNIEIDDELMDQAMKAGPYKTKREAVEAGLKLLARQVTYREILKWQGKLKWEGDESIDWTKPEEPEAEPELKVSEALAGQWPEKTEAQPKKSFKAALPTPKKRRVGR